ncbi:methylthioribose-1-phosphate isomerase [Sulfobacillus thermosulfidooxidans DSM 9293]|uniref:Methylthioribose-1-phosphate isomerase n=1 Tax=Sulfobacillus thermosulfidooxidans (strain DSM 9293 / VKM B-1269 / AT-1) TaxID=929705 RepID=A0A1W1WBA0_SULTA|nr:S-methyl-5-thioribose-1-phosphate isomerase [Sulfobacillus thermosulfidooxidans]SMC03588.1 methylthioribose-1-phosphate isomerase [Sulfobacillus thermosulfidooxidans DSM 9293]
MDPTFELVEAIRATDNAVYLLDQRQLPDIVDYLPCTTGQDVIQAIQVLAVRGAPAIGIAGAYGLWLESRRLRDTPNFHDELKKSAEQIQSARPTAVNLSWAVRYALSHVQSLGVDDTIKTLKQIADQLLAEDVALNRQIGDWGLSLFDGKVSLLTHCNTGSLATGGYGTALGVIRSLFREHRLREVFVDETRPLLQGARLTAWELSQEKIPARLITDSMAGSVMAQHLVDGVIVGADRIALNGDTANKIGTYSVAVLAHYHQIPFYVAAPLSTFDANALSGADIPIEMRNPDEIRKLRGVNIAPEEIETYNPAFDITPGRLITAFITEKGVIRPPFDKTIRDMVSGNAP